MKLPKQFLFNGEIWKFKHETVNKAVYKNEHGQEKTFSHWQIVEGDKKCNLTK